MDLFTLESIGTLAGASLAVGIIIAAVKGMSGLTGRMTQVVTLLLSIGISVGYAATVTHGPIPLAALNGFVIAAMATAGDNYVNYGGKG